MSTLLVRFAIVLALLLVTAETRAQITCGATVTASVTLTADVTCPDTRGIVVGADKITVDLNGFTLSGDGGVGDVGIDNGLGFDGVVVKNGTVRSFDEGISIGGDAQKNAITGVTIRDCVNDAIDLNDSDFTKVSKTTIVASGVGVQIGELGTGNVIEKSFVVAIDQTGIDIAGSGNVVQKTHVSGAQDGIRVRGSGNRVVGNNVDRCRAMSVAIGGGLGNLVTKNTLTGAAGSGVDVRTATGTIIKSNVAHGNGNYGVAVFAGGDGSIVEKNQVRGSDLSGIWVEDASGVRVVGNTVTGSREDGIHVGPTTTVTKNVARANQLVGLRAAPPGAIDGGGNKASAHPFGDCEGFDCTP